MADDEETRQVADLVRSLVEEGRSFAISVEDPDPGLLEEVEVGSSEFSASLTSRRCIRWVYVPGRGLVCVQWDGG